MFENYTRDNFRAVKMRTPISLFENWQGFFIFNQFKKMRIK